MRMISEGYPSSERQRGVVLFFRDSLEAVAAPERLICCSASNQSSKRHG